MAYLDRFSEATIARVNATTATAERDFAQAERGLSPSFSKKYERAVEELVKQYIFSILRTFIPEAIRGGKEHGWPPGQIKGEVLEFCRCLIFSADDKCRYRNGMTFIRNAAWEFRSQVWDEIDHSDLWLSFLDELAGIANVRAAVFSEDPLTSTRVLHDSPPGWANIEICFLSDDRIEITQSGRTDTRNYSEMGFEDRRNGTPTKAWETLRTLAENDGVLESKSTSRAWRHVEKDVQAIRQALKKHFGISADPLPYEEGVGYRAQLKIGRAPSFDS